VYVVCQNIDGHSAINKDVRTGVPGYLLVRTESMDFFPDILVLVLEKIEAMIQV
jgi:hypothetical protein